MAGGTLTMSGSGWSVRLTEKELRAILLALGPDGSKHEATAYAKVNGVLLKALSHNHRRET